MKKLILVLGVLMGLMSTSYALNAKDSTNKTFYNQALMSGVLNSNTAFVTGTSSSGDLMAYGSTPITGISLSGGASGGTVTIYDANTAVIALNAVGGGANTTNLQEVGPQECVFEATVAANTTSYIDLSNAPIATQTGVVAMASSTAGVVVYTSSSIASNH